MALESPGLVPWPQDAAPGALPEYSDFCKRGLDAPATLPGAQGRAMLVGSGAQAGKGLGVPMDRCCLDTMGTGRDSPPEVTWAPRAQSGRAQSATCGSLWMCGVGSARGTLRQDGHS